MNFSHLKWTGLWEISIDWLFEIIINQTSITDEGRYDNIVFISNVHYIRKVLFSEPCSHECYVKMRESWRIKVCGMFKFNISLVLFHHCWSLICIISCSNSVRNLSMNIFSNVFGKCVWSILSRISCHVDTSVLSWIIWNHSSLVLVYWFQESECIIFFVD